jgi:hypothetical protein
VGVQRLPQRRNRPQRATRRLLWHTQQVLMDLSGWVTKQTADRRGREEEQNARNESSLILECDQNIAPSSLHEHRQVLYIRM